MMYDTLQSCRDRMTSTKAKRVRLIAPQTPPTQKPAAALWRVCVWGSQSAAAAADLAVIWDRPPPLSQQPHRPRARPPIPKGPNGMRFECAAAPKHQTHRQSGAEQSCAGGVAPASAAIGSHRRSPVVVHTHTAGEPRPVGSIARRRERLFEIECR